MGTISQSFLAALKEEQTQHFTACNDLDDRLEQLVGRSREACPEMVVEASAFVAYLAERLPKNTSSFDDIEKLCVEDLYLACAVSAGDEAAVALVRERYFARVQAALSRIGLRDAVDETAQRVFSELLVIDENGRCGVQGYRGTSSLGAFVKVIAVRTANRARKKQQRERPTDDAVLMERAAIQTDPELQILKKKYRSEFKSAFHEALAKLAVRDRNVLRYELVGGLNIDQIGGLYDVHRATVARWKKAARAELFKETRVALQAKLAISPTEFRSIVRLIESEFNLSLTRALREFDE